MRIMGCLQDVFGDWLFETCKVSVNKFVFNKKYGCLSVLLITPETDITGWIVYGDW